MPPGQLFCGPTALLLYLKKTVLPRSGGVLKSRKRRDNSIRKLFHNQDPEQQRGEARFNNASYWKPGTYTPMQGRCSRVSFGPSYPRILNFTAYHRSVLTSMRSRVSRLAARKRAFIWDKIQTHERVRGSNKGRLALPTDGNNSSLWGLRSCSKEERIWRFGRKAQKAVPGVAGCWPRRNFPSQVCWRNSKYLKYPMASGRCG